MSTPNIIATAIIIIAFLGIVGIRLYKTKKNGGSMSFDDFMSEYEDQLIRVLENAIMILQINIDEFDDKESYEKSIISTTINILKDNAEQFGIDQTIVSLFSTDALTDALYTLFNKNILEVFSVLTKEQIDENTRLYSSDVIESVATDDE
jgi:hypothetical protein